MDASVFENCSLSIEEPGRSSHHGEGLICWKATKNDFDFFNVMTYDAGRNLYEVAMANYAEYIGDKSKIVLGNTIVSRGAPGGNLLKHVRTTLDRAKWQKDNVTVALCGR